jgi:hypothetical protein
LQTRPREHQARPRIGRSLLQQRSRERSDARCPGDAIGLRNERELDGPAQSLGVRMRGGKSLIDERLRQRHVGAPERQSREVGKRQRVDGILLKNLAPCLLGAE